MKRKHHGKRKEDYLETIYLIGKEKRIIRIKDIADKLNVKKSSVVAMLEKLVKEECIVHEKYSDVTLTRKGMEKAQNVYKKHTTIYSFLKEILNVEENTAQTDACNLEHYISDMTNYKLIKFIQYFNSLVSKDNDIKKGLLQCYDSSDGYNSTDDNLI